MVLQAETQVFDDAFFGDSTQFDLVANTTLIFDSQFFGTTGQFDTGSLISAVGQIRYRCGDHSST